MAYGQIRDLLQWVVDFHEELGRQYRNLAKEKNDERMQMALDFLADREGKMQRSIKGYIDDASPVVLDTWLSDSHDFAHPRLLERIPRCLDCKDVRDILLNAIAAHKTLQDLYVLRAELAQTPGEKELFETLAANQDAEARLQSRDIGRLEMS